MKKQNQKTMLMIGLIVAALIAMQSYHPEPEAFIEPEIEKPLKQDRPFFPGDNPRWGGPCQSDSDCFNFPPKSYDGIVLYDAEGNAYSSTPIMICQGGYCKWP